MTIFESVKIGKSMFRTVVIGNLKMHGFFAVITKVWEEVLKTNVECKLVNVFTDRIEGIK